MTIYAIVNSLLPSSPNTSHPVWTLISPAGILQGGNPYFVPDFASVFEARMTMAVRIGKLGKGIAQRFVSRYIDAVAPAVMFVATDLLHQLKADGCPWTAALSYDRCLAIGKFRPMSFEEIKNCKCSIELHSTDSSDVTTFNNSNMSPTPAEIVEAISRDNTLKTGDILLTGLSGGGLQVKPGLRAILRMNGEESLRFNIR